MRFGARPSAKEPGSTLMRARGFSERRLNVSTEVIRWLCGQRRSPFDDLLPTIVANARDKTPCNEAPPCSSTPPAPPSSPSDCSGPPKFVPDPCARTGERRRSLKSRESNSDCCESQPLSSRPCPCPESRDPPKPPEPPKICYRKCPAPPRLPRLPRFPKIPAPPRPPPLPKLPRMPRCPPPCTPPPPPPLPKCPRWPKCPECSPQKERPSLPPCEPCPCPPPCPPPCSPPPPPCPPFPPPPSCSQPPRLSSPSPASSERAPCAPSQSSGTSSCRESSEPPACSDEVGASGPSSRRGERKCRDDDSTCRSDAEPPVKAKKRGASDYRRVCLSGILRRFRPRGLHTSAVRPKRRSRSGKGSKTPAPSCKPVEEACGLKTDKKQCGKPCERDEDSPCYPEKVKCDPAQRKTKDAGKNKKKKRKKKKKEQDCHASCLPRSKCESPPTTAAPKMDYKKPVCPPPKFVTPPPCPPVPEPVEDCATPEPLISKPKPCEPPPLPKPPTDPVELCPCPPPPKMHPGTCPCYSYREQRKVTPGPACPAKKSYPCPEGVVCYARKTKCEKKKDCDDVKGKKKK